MQKFEFNLEDEKKAKNILCKICKKTFKDPVMLPCLNNICYSHFDIFINVDRITKKNYFDCDLCYEKHYFNETDKKFSFNKSLDTLCKNSLTSSTNVYTDIYENSKQMLNELKADELNYENVKECKKMELVKYFSELKLKVELRRDQITIEIKKIADDFIKQINKKENKYLNDLNKIYESFNFENLKLKTKTYAKELSKYKIDLKIWSQINESLKESLNEYESLTKNSNDLILSCENIEFKEETFEDLTKSFGKLNEKSTKLIISGSYDRTIKVWDISEGTCIRTINDDESDGVHSLALIDDHEIASGSKDATIKIWNIKTGQCLKILKGHTDCIEALKSFNKQTILSGSWDKTIKVWDLKSGICLKTLSGHSFSVTCLEMTNDNEIISCSLDSTIKLWNLDTGNCKKTFTGHSGAIWSIYLTNDKKIVSGSLDRTVRIWGIELGICLKILYGHQSGICSVKPYSDEQFITSSSDGDIKIWNYKDGVCVRTIKGDSSYFYAFEITKDGNIIKGCYNNSIKLWNLDSGELVYDLGGHLSCVRTLVKIE